MIYQVDISETTKFLGKIIRRRIDEKGENWVNLQETKFRENFQLHSFYFSFSSASRFIEKKPLSLSKEEKVIAEQLRQGFNPEVWDLLQCVRTYLLLMLPNKNIENYFNNLSRLFETADADEQIALYRGLPLFPYPAKLVKRALEGLRTNITDVFDAIALDNPYPADFLDQRAWNQMLLKTVFLQRPLYRVVGADERANPELARMLIDFAHERWAAGREVLPELWRFVGPYIDNGYFPDIEKAVKGKLLEEKAGLLACNMSSMPVAQKLLNKHPEVKKEIDSGMLTWDIIGKEYENKQKV